MTAHSEMDKICFARSNLGDEPKKNVFTSWHGNIKPSNVFVECSGQNANYMPYLVFSDRAINIYEQVELKHSEGKWRGNMFSMRI